MSEVYGTAFDRKMLNMELTRCSLQPLDIPELCSRFNRPGALDISFHFIFLRILVSLKVFAIFSAIRIWRSVRFPRVPTVYRDQKSTQKKDPFSCHKSHAQIFYHGLVCCCRSEKCKNWPKIRVPKSIWPLQSRLEKDEFSCHEPEAENLCHK